MYILYTVFPLPFITTDTFANTTKFLGNLSLYPPNLKQKVFFFYWMQNAFIFNCYVRHIFISVRGNFETPVFHTTVMFARNIS